MKVRPARAEDIEFLRGIYEKANFDYVFPDLDGPMIEGVLVAVNERDEPVAGVILERLVQAYGFVSDDLEPSAKLFALAKLQEHSIPLLFDRGYNDCNAFLPPQAEKSFGRRLMRSLGWTKNWTSLNRRF